MPRKITDKIFKQRVYNQVGNEYITLTPYVKGYEKVKFKHTKCNNTFWMTPNHFLVDHRRCSYCNHGNAKSPEEFAKEFCKVAGKHYMQLTAYHRSHEKIKVIHVDCGNKYWVDPDSFVNGGRRCPKCYGNIRKTIKQFREEVSTLTHGEYACVSKYYVNNRTNVEIKHLVCGNKYKVTPHDFVEGNRCPYCKQSKGERLVQSILEKNGVPYEIQKRFKWCRRENGSYLPFDFYLPNMNMCIEYDGIQHFKSVKYFGGKKKLLSQQDRDNFKNRCCLSKKISVIRVPYNLSPDLVESKLMSVIISRQKAKDRIAKIIRL